MTLLKGKERVDKFSQQLYCKDWESLEKTTSKYRAMALALDESENELTESSERIKELETLMIEIKNNWNGSKLIGGTYEKICNELTKTQQP